MNDIYLFAVFGYLAIVILAVSVLPASLYIGSDYNLPTSEDLQSDFNVTAEETDNLIDQLSFFKRFLTFFFISWTIDGIPAFFGLLITFLNIGALVVPIIWFYDKLRGIS